MSRREVDPLPAGVDAEILGRLRRLAEAIDASLPEAYRTAAFATLAPRVQAERIDEDGLDLDAYMPILMRRGDVLLKALAGLHLAETFLEVRWMTPAELADLLGEKAGARSVYRSNLSNALRRETALVARQRRGRGWCYSLTDQGRRRIEREMRLARTR